MTLIHWAYLLLRHWMEQREDEPRCRRRRAARIVWDYQLAKDVAAGERARINPVARGLHYHTTFGSGQTRQPNARDSEIICAAVSRSRGTGQDQSMSEGHMFRLLADV